MSENGISLINYLTFDIEDYFHVHALSKVIKPADWDNYECRVEKNTYFILDLLDTYRSIQNSTSDIQNSEFKIQNSYRATFFILGWIAERYPKLVKEIHARGHEIASHGYGHRVIYKQSKDEFREDVKRAKKILEDLTGEEVLGYRAPTYSITDKTIWALYILREEGYRYDSSIFPIRHDYYGMPHCPRFPFIWNLDSPKPKMKQMPPNCLASPPPSRQAAKPPSHILEFPLSTLKLVGQKLPIAGGGYFRLFPYWFTRWALKRINRQERQPFIFYLHPWELDPEIPKIKNAQALSRFRTYVNLSKTKTRFKRLLAEFDFQPIRFHLLKS